MDKDLASLAAAVESLEKSDERLERALEKNSRELVQVFEKQSVEITGAMKEIASCLADLTTSMAERVIIDQMSDKRISSLEQKDIIHEGRLSKVEKISALTDNFRQSTTRVVLSLVVIILGAAVIGGLMFKFSAGG